MALDLDIKLNALSADCGQLTLINQTVFGGENPTRDQIAIFLIGYKKGLPSESDQKLTIVQDTADPLVNDTWYVTSADDGWHSFPCYAIPLYNGAATYSVGQVVYYSSVYWKCLASASGIAPGSNPSYWQQLLVDDANLETTIDVFEAADNVTYKYFNFIVTCRSEKCYSKLVVAAANEGCCEGCTDAELKQTYERVDVLLNGTFSLCTQLRYAEAEENIRNITHICKKSKCVCD